MAIVVRNTNYNGEVLEKILTLATTGNDLVEKGLIMVIPGVEKKISLPRIKTGRMLQKRKENPTLEDSKGNFNYSEKSLDPEDFMAFTTFNPRAFEHIWRKWQPKGNLVFSELPPEAQNTLLDELSKSVKFELGWHYINGEFGDDDDHLFNGILTQAARDTEVVVVSAPSDTSSMLAKLKAVRAAVPKALRENPNLRILMSIDDFDKYDNELTEREYKNASETDLNKKRYKGITIETLNSWPDDLIVATICSPSADGNLFAGVNLQDDEEVIQIDKWMNSSELYFFKLLMKADTNIAFGEEFVVLDTRKSPVFKPAEKTLSADPTEVTIKPEGSSQDVAVTASGEYSVSASPAGFTVSPTDNGIRISAAANTTGKDKSGAVTLTLDSDKTRTVKITVSQAKQEA
nr:MAG TPA: major capsid protein [Caudoviricetes sp.]